MRPLLAVLAMLAVLAVATAQITEPGICPFSIPLADWNEEQFVSEPWYEIKALAVPGLHSLRPGCTQWHFRPSDNGHGLHARLAYRTGEGDDAVVRAFAQYTTSEKHPRFNLTFHDLDGVGSSRSVHMKLVATDYDDFALLWGCTEPNLFERRVVSWVLSRRPFLSEDAQDALRSVLRAHDIRPDQLVETDHGDQTCGAPGPSEELPEDSVENQTDSVFAPFRKQDAQAGELRGADRAGADSRDVNGNNERYSGFVDADTVSSSYVGSGWQGVFVETLGAQGVLVAALLALALVSLLASLLTFRALVSRGHFQTKGKSVLPVHRQDVVVATLGSGVDYSRFGGLGGLGQLQTRKNVVDVSAVAPRA